MPCRILGWPTASFIGWTRCLLPYSFQSCSMQFCPENLYNLQQATTYVVLFYVHVFILIYYSSKQVLNTSQLFHFQSSSCTPGSAQSNVVIWWELPEPARNWPFRKELGPWAPVSRLENTKSPHWKKPCKVPSVESCSLTWQEPLGSSEFIRKPSTIIDETGSSSEQVCRHEQNPQCATGFSHRRMIFEKPKHHLRLNACGWSNGSRRFIGRLPRPGRRVALEHHMWSQFGTPTWFLLGCARYRERSLWSTSILGSGGLVW